MSYPDPEGAALVALLRMQPKGVSWPQIAAQVVEAGSAVEVRERNASVQAALFGADDEPLEQAQADLERWRSQGVTVLTVLDAGYPAQLREIHEMPPILFSPGTLVPSARGVSIVGSRAADGDALAFAEQVAHGLVSRGLSVLSGLARGVDTAAHLTALSAAGRTVAFLGTGIYGFYPAENAD